MNKSTKYFNSVLRRASNKGKSKDSSPVTKADDSRRGFLGMTAVGLGAATFAYNLSGEAQAQPVIGIGEEFNVKDYGAAGNGSTNDSAAFQAAIDAAAAAGGGTVLVPNGIFVIGSPVVKNFNSIAAKLIIRGLGTSSQVVVKTGASSRAFEFTNLLDLVVEHVAFVGTPGVATDASRTLDLTSVNRAVVRHCQFYGVSSEHADGAIIAVAGGTILSVEHCAFLGSASKANGVVYGDGWGGFKVTDTCFLDYGNLNGFVHSKTPGTVTTAWIRLKRPGGNFTATQDQGEVFIREVRMDEGSLLGVYIDPPENTPRIGHVFISGLRMNGNGLGNSGGVHIRRATNVFIERSWIGYNAHDTPHPAFYLIDSGDVILDAVRCEQGFSTIFADSATTSLTVRNSIYKTLNSSAKNTIVIKNGLQVLPAPPPPPPSGGSTGQMGGVNYKTISVGDNYTVTDTDYFVLVSPSNRNIVITLPDPRGRAGRVYVIKRTGGGSGTITIAQSGAGVEIDNSLSNYPMGTGLNVRATLISSGSHWYVIG
jgi:Pectate lyase superfamily protein